MSDKRNISLLIIEDTEAQRALYKEWLTDIDPNVNYIFYEAEGGKSGYDQYIDIKPDCIILDFLMSDVDGFEFISNIKSLWSSLPPIIFVTGINDELVKEDALAVGVKVFLSKQDLNAEALHKAIIEVSSE